MASRAISAYISVLASHIPQPCPSESKIFNPSQREYPTADSKERGRMHQIKEDPYGPS